MEISELHSKVASISEAAGQSMGALLSSSSSSTADLSSDDLPLLAKSLEDLEKLRVSYLGKKGEFTSLMKSLKDVPADLRRDAGAELNKAKVVLEKSFIENKSKLSELHEQALLVGQRIDVSLPVKAPILTTSAGSLHPVTRVQHELTQIFLSLGFTVVDGPEVETEHYNFDALNIPSTHPARDMQDTIWAATGELLRTHTSTMQVRGMEAIGAPLRIVAPGRCFRYERLDATHEHTFYQMDGMMIDRKVTVGHLLYFMKTLLREIFGFEPKIRLRPGYFPFVEPGFELDIWFEDRWMELLPCGLTHPRVLEAGGINPNEWQGFAFGLGLSRLVMSRFGIDDIRYLQGGDLRFLKQFS